MGCCFGFEGGKAEVKLKAVPEVQPYTHRGCSEQAGAEGEYVQCAHPCSGEHPTSSALLGYQSRVCCRNRAPLWHQQIQLREAVKEFAQGVSPFKGVSHVNP